MARQTESTECGLACLAMIAGYHGHEAGLRSLRHRFGTSLKGAQLSRLIDIAHSLGFETRPLRSELEYLRHAQLPCILHWDFNHFVVLAQVTTKGAHIYDPAGGHYCMPLTEAGKHFTGVLLELSPSADFTPIKQPRRISIRVLTGRVVGLKRVCVQIIGLAVAIEVTALVIPFQMQWVMDHVLESGDKGLLLLITLGFLITTAIRTGLTVARAWILSWLGATLDRQWVTNLFGHLLKLPMDYFEKRHMGDVVSRFSSIQSVQNTVTGSFVEAVLDGLMGSLALLAMALYSAAMTGCVLVALAIYASLRWALYRTLSGISEEYLIYRSRQQTTLMESVRGVQAIKLANKQADRKARLGNATMEAAVRAMRTQRITLSISALNDCISTTLRISLIAIGAYLAIDGRFSAGMLVAFVSYSDQFSSKFGSLVDKVVDFRMLGLHAERIADIALAPPELHTSGAYQGEEPQSSIDVKDLSFRYAEGEPWIIYRLNFTIQSGQSLAIAGPSGCGKSTLAKLLLGLLTPIEGSIQVGGIDIRRFGLENYRKIIGAVMQDDSLFSGSIADNIAFFDATASMEDIKSAASLAQVHEDIVAMPMGYESLVGDMGSALSGGQKQRVILARALFRRPKILVMDEATSHLDPPSEALINRNVTALNMTRILFAHRAETIASAQKVLQLKSLWKNADMT